MSSSEISSSSNNSKNELCPCPANTSIKPEDRVPCLERALSQTRNTLKAKESMVKMQKQQLKKLEDMYKKCLEENDALSYANKKTMDDLENLRIINKQYEGKIVNTSNHSSRNDISDINVSSNRSSKDSGHIANKHSIHGSTDGELCDCSAECNIECIKANDSADEIVIAEVLPNSNSIGDGHESITQSLEGNNSSSIKNKMKILESNENDEVLCECPRLKPQEKSEDSPDPRSNSNSPRSSKNESIDQTKETNSNPSEDSDSKDKAPSPKLNSLDESNRIESATVNPESCICSNASCNRKQGSIKSNSPKEASIKSGSLNTSSHESSRKGSDNSSGKVSENPSVITEELPATNSDQNRKSCACPTDKPDENLQSKSEIENVDQDLNADEEVNIDQELIVDVIEVHSSNCSNKGSVHSEQSNSQRSSNASPKISVGNSKEGSKLIQNPSVISEEIDVVDPTVTKKSCVCSSKKREGSQKSKSVDSANVSNKASAEASDESPANGSADSSKKGSADSKLVDEQSVGKNSVDASNETEKKISGGSSKEGSTNSKLVTGQIVDGSSGEVADVNACLARDKKRKCACSSKEIEKSSSLIEDQQSVTSSKKGSVSSSIKGSPKKESISSKSHSGNEIKSTNSSVKSSESPKSNKNVETVVQSAKCACAIGVIAETSLTDDEVIEVESIPREDNHSSSNKSNSDHTDPIEIDAVGSLKTDSAESDKVSEETVNSVNEKKHCVCHIKSCKQHLNADGTDSPKSQNSAKSSSLNSSKKGSLNESEKQSNGSQNSSKKGSLNGSEKQSQDSSKKGSEKQSNGSQNSSKKGSLNGSENQSQDSSKKGSSNGSKHDSQESSKNSHKNAGNEDEMKKTGKGCECAISSSVKTSSLTPEESIKSSPKTKSITSADASPKSKSSTSADGSPAAEEVSSKNSKVSSNSSTLKAGLAANVTCVKNIKIVLESQNSKLETILTLLRTQGDSNNFEELRDEIEVLKNMLQSYKETDNSPSKCSQLEELNHTLEIEIYDLREQLQKSQRGMEDLGMILINDITHRSSDIAKSIKSKYNNNCYVAEDAELIAGKIEHFLEEVAALHSINPRENPEIMNSVRSEMLLDGKLNVYSLESKVKELDRAGDEILTQIKTYNNELEEIKMCLLKKAEGLKSKVDEMTPRDFVYDDYPEDKNRKKTCNECFKDEQTYVDEIAQLKQELAKRKEEMGTMQGVGCEAIPEYEKEIVNLRKQLKQLQNELDEYKKEVGRGTEKSQSVSNEKDEQLRKLNMEMGFLNEDFVKVNEDYTKLLEDYDKSQLEVQRLNDQIMEFSEKHKEKDTAICKFKDTFKDLTEELKNVMATKCACEELRLILKENEEKMLGLQKVNDQLETELEGFKGKLTKANETTEYFNEKLEEALCDCDRFKAQIHEAKTSNAKLKATCCKLEEVAEQQRKAKESYKREFCEYVKNSPTKLNTSTCNSQSRRRISNKVLIDSVCCENTRKKSEAAQPDLQSIIAECEQYKSKLDKISLKIQRHAKEHAVYRQEAENKIIALTNENEKLKKQVMEEACPIIRGMKCCDNVNIQLCELRAFVTAADGHLEQIVTAKLKAKEILEKMTYKTSSVCQYVCNYDTNNMGTSTRKNESNEISLKMSFEVENEKSKSVFPSTQMLMTNTSSLENPFVGDAVTMTEEVDEIKDYLKCVKCRKPCPENAQCKEEKTKDSSADKE